MLKYIDRHGNITPLTKYSNLYIEDILEYGDKVLSFDIPVKIGKNIGQEEFIRTKADEFVIKQINSASDGYLTLTAQLNIDELEGTPFESFETAEKTALESADLALAGTGWLCDCDCGKKRTIRLTNTSSWSILKKIADTYMLEMKIDSLNKRIVFREKIGEDKGVYFADQLNLISLDMQSNTSDFYTRILPIGKDGLTIESVNNGSKFVENHTFSSKVKTYIWKDERYTSPESLMADAEAKLSDMAQPYKSYTCKVADLSKYGKRVQQEYAVGDIVTIINKDTRTRVKQRIVKLRRYPDDSSKDTCEISNLRLTFDKYVQKYNSTAETVNNITTDNGTVNGDCIDSIDADKVIRLEEVMAKSAKFVEVSTQVLNVSSQLNAANARIGSLETTKLTATEAELKYATIENLTAATGRIGTLEANALTAGSALIHSLTSDIADINTLMFGTASGGSLTTEFSNSVVSMIGDAQIKSAMIKDISADKINAGKIYTNLVQICSQSGNLNMADNTILIKDNNQTARVQIGKDGAGDYNIYIWDSDGALMFDPLYGVQESGIKRAIIRDDMVSDKANISAKKLDISSLFTEINGSTEVIRSSKIFVDSDNQTLDVSFKNMTTSVTEATAKADNVYNLAESANANASAALDRANSMAETVSSQGTQLTAIQGQISSKVWQQDITTAVDESNRELTNKYTSLNQSLTSLTATVNSNTTAISKKADGSTVTELQSDVTAIRADLTGFKTTVSSSYATKSEFNNLQIGGRNLFLNTANAFEIQGNSGVNQTKGFYNISSTEYASKQVTMSFDWELSGESATGGTFVVQYNKSPWSWLGEQVYPSANLKSGRYVRTFNMPSVGVTGTMVRLDNFTGNLTIKNVKLELGGKATHWTPAPEDVDSKFKDYSTTVQMNSAIEQKSSSILQTVSATYATQSTLSNYATTQSVTASLALKIGRDENSQIVSMINASADLISLKANRFQLESTYTTITKEGIITCNSLISNNAAITGGYININTDLKDTNVIKLNYAGGSSIIQSISCPYMLQTNHTVNNKTIARAALISHSAEHVSPISFVEASTASKCSRLQYDRLSFLTGDVYNDGVLSSAGDIWTENAKLHYNAPGYGHYFHQPVYGLCARVGVINPLVTSATNNNISIAWDSAGMQLRFYVDTTEIYTVSAAGVRWVM